MFAIIGLVAWGIFGLPLLDSFSRPQEQPTPTQSSEQRKDKDDKHTQDGGFRDWMTHDAAGFFTSWLVIIGGLQLALFGWQLLLIRESLDDATIAANAAPWNHDLLRRPILPPNDLRANLEVACPENIAFDFSAAQFNWMLDETRSPDIPEWTDVTPTGLDEGFLRIRVQIWYRGPFGGSYETSSCWRYDPKEACFFEWDRNYMK